MPNDLVNRESPLQTTNAEDDQMSKFITMMMTMFMVMMMMDMMSRMLTPVSADTGVARTSYGGLTWDWVIEGSEGDYYEFGNEYLAPYKGTVVGDWASGVAPSGSTGSELLNVGSGTDLYKVSSLIISLFDLSAGSTVTIRLYRSVGGIDTCFYDEEFTAGSDPDGIPVVSGPLSIQGLFRVEVQSDNVADDGAAIAYSMILALPTG